MRKRYRDCPCTSLPHSCLACSIVLIFIFMYVFIQLHWVLSEECGIFSCGMTIFCLVAECVIQFPDYGLNPGPLHWECWDLTTGPYWNSSLPIVQFSHVWLFATPWIAAHQASLFITNSWSSLKLMSIESVMPAISSSVIPFSSCPQSLPALGSFPMSQLFAWGGQRIGVSALASVLPKNTQDWSPLEWTGWISLKFKGFSRVISNTTVQKHQFFSSQLSSQSNSHIHTWPLKKQ